MVASQLALFRAGDCDVMLAYYPSFTHLGLESLKRCFYYGKSRFNFGSRRFSYPVWIGTGDADSYNRLAAHFEKRLFLFAQRLTGDPEMALEASQDALGGYRARLTTPASPRLFRAWAYKIVSRRCTDHIRKITRR